MLIEYDAVMTITHPTSLPAMKLADLPVGSLVLCATRRLAQMLGQAHDQAAGKAASWATLQASPIKPWLASVQEAAAFRGASIAALDGVRVLDDFQARLIWEQVIHESLDRNAGVLFDVGALAATAADAHALSIHWGIATADSFANTEQQQFQRWQSRFRERCQTEKLIDPASLHALLIDQLERYAPSLPTHIVFAGFDHYTPLEQRLQTRLREAGVSLAELATTRAITDPQINAYAAPDQTSECLTVAQWAHQHLQSNHEARLGIVIPDLASYQHTLPDALEDVLDPTLILARNAATTRPFNISLGQPLSGLPVVRAALALLQILTQSHAVEQSLISELLHSPYWSNHAQEYDARARLAAALREGVAPKAPLKRYCGYAHYLFERQKLSAPETLGFLNALLAASSGLTHSSRLPSAWRRTVQSLLGKVGWLSDGHLRSAEFQTREAFGKELGKLAQLDQITGKITFSKAVSLLTQLCSERLFQPKTRGTPPIQILGVLEATGLEFDAVWMMGMTDKVWPPAARPNPLLSAEAQRQAGSPNACASVQLAFARSIQQRILQSAPEIRVSYPRQDTSSEQQPSPLILDLAPDALQELTPLPLPWAVLEPTALEAIDDAQAPAVPEGEAVQGGTGLLRAQAICPAWGYYQYRLGAKKLAEPVEGLDPRQRGSLVHDTLELFWNETRTLRALMALSDQDRHLAISQAATAALDKLDADQKREALKPRQRLLEHKRLIRLLDDWLQLEMTRREDFIVLEAEGAREVSIEGIQAKMRIDRIDQLADGRTVIIDYKTGASIDIKNWADERITEPQLPIYAAIAEHDNPNIAGVAFALVHLSGAAFKGVGQDDHLLPNVHAISSNRGRKQFSEEQFPDWQSVLNHWRDSIRAVAREIREGDASIRITRETDIRYCDVQPLLRLAERDQQMNAANTGDAS